MMMYQEVLMNILSRQILILSCALTVMFPFQSSAARLAPPVLSMKKSAAGNITISWRLARGKWNLPIAKKLLIERRKAGSSHMRFVLDSPAYLGAWMDTPEAAGTYIYKVRAAKGKKQSAVKILRAKIDIQVPALRPLPEGFSRCENSELIELINAERKNAGLAELVRHPLLEWAADSQTIDSYDGSEWTNIDPNPYVAESGFGGTDVSRLGFYGIAPAGNWIIDVRRSVCQYPKLMDTDYRYIGEVCMVDAKGFPARLVIIAGAERIYR